MNRIRVAGSGASVACLLMTPTAASVGLAVSASPSPTASASPATWASLRPAVSYSRAKLPSTETLWGMTAHETARVRKAGTIGWEFTPAVDIEVTALGCFDGGCDGLARAHRVGSFDAGSKRLLVSVTVPPKSRLEGSFRWESLKTPLVLKVERSYVVGTEDKKTLEAAYTWHNWPRVEGWPPAGEHWAKEVGFPALRNLAILVSRPS